MRARSLNFYALSEQFINSFWTFIAMRYTYENSELHEIPLIGLAVFFAVSASGLLRSMYVHPLFAVLDQDNPRRVFPILPLFSMKRITTFFLLMILSEFIFLRITEISSIKLLLEIFFLTISIVCLDFFRSFQQLNYEYRKLIVTDLVGITIFLGMHFFSTWPTAFSLNVNPLSAWIVSNLLGACLLFRQLVSSEDRNSIRNSQVVEVPTAPVRYSLIIATEFTISRASNIVGLAVLYRIDQVTSANLALALFVYSTIPYSFSNGLLPVFFRNRLVKQGNSYRNRFFLITSMTLLLIPTTSILVPDLMTLIFGELWRLPFLLVFYVVLTVALKIYDSAQSLDYMLQNQTFQYFMTKIPLILLVNLICPILLGLYSMELACLVVVFSMGVQIVIMERKLS
jgi:hypothetical protein